MSPEQIKNIIILLPDIFLYFVPGAIFLSLFYFICSKENNKETENYFVFKSIMISFIIISLLKVVAKIIRLFYKFQITSTEKMIIAIITSALLAYFVSRYYNSKHFKSAVKKIGINKSLYNNIWNDVVDFERGMWLRVYLPSEGVVYNGKLRKYEEKAENYFLFLSNYQSWNYGDYNYIEDNENDDAYWVALNTKDIGRIEILFEDDSDCK